MFQKYIPEVAEAISQILGTEKDQTEKQFYKALPNFVRFAEEPPPPGPSGGGGNGGPNGTPPPAAGGPAPKPRPRTPDSPAAAGKRKRKPAGEQLALLE